MAAPYRLSDAVATTIAKLTTCNEKLPIGAPTSPILSNILCSGIDATLAEVAKNHGCFFTRYADDLTFSTNRRNFPRALAELEVDDGHTVTIPGKELVMAIEGQGFKVNARKTRLLSKFDRQEVCGIVCNEKLNVLPKLRRQIRASLHAWRKFGLEAAEKEWAEKYNFRQAASFEISLRGKIEFFKHVRGENDPLVAKYAGQFNALRTDAREVKYTVVSDWRRDLARTSCCIHSYTSVGDDMCQGSGFVIAGGYVVTNRHVVVSRDGRSFDDITLTLPGALKIDIDVEIVAELVLQDLALLRPKDSMWREVLKEKTCVISDRDAEREDVVWLSGWPNYHDGDEVHLIQGSVVGNSYPDGIRMFRISPNIVFGNSGGAVFNEAGEVIGVATRGSDVADAPLTVHNGCVPASHIAQLVAQFAGANNAANDIEIGSASSVG